MAKVFQIRVVELNADETETLHDIVEFQRESAASLNLSRGVFSLCEQITADIDTESERVTIADEAKHKRARIIDKALTLLYKDRALAILDGDSLKIGNAESAIISMEATIMANAEQAERSDYGTFECVQCNEEFTTANPCCCDDASYDNGSHRDGVCVRCCAPHHAAMPKRDFVNQRGE